MTTANPFLAVEQRMLGDIHTSSEPMDNLVVLCDEFGSRAAGTPGERQAADFFVRKFSEYGLRNAHLEEYGYYGWARGEAKLEIVAPVRKAIACISLPMSPAGEVEAEIVSLRDGAPADFEAAGEALRGKIAMVGARPPRGLNRTVHRSEKFNRSVLGGAAAFLYVSQYEAYGPETGSIANDRPALIPGISISKESGAYLQRLAERHGTVRLRLRTTDQHGPTQSWNVIAELPGNAKSDEWVILGCHYDGHDIAQGAEDPASGAVAVLEAARVLAAHAAAELGCGIRFIEFGTEEIGLIGAYRYAAAHRDELAQIRFMLNMDAAGCAGRKGVTINRWPELDAFFATARREMKTDLPTGQKTGAFSDHFPFFLEGVPTGMMGDPDAANTGRGFGHSAYDTLDKIHLDNLRAAAGVACRLALRISRAESWPAKLRSKDVVQKLIDAEPNLEMLKLRPQIDALYARG